MAPGSGEGLGDGSSVSEGVGDRDADGLADGGTVAGSTSGEDAHDASDAATRTSAPTNDRLRIRRW